MQQEQEYLTQTPSIQWFPGHMAKTRRVMKESLGLVDIVVELRDARIPKSSRNPEIEKIIGDKPRLVVFNKADIADPAVTKQWQEYYKSHGVRTLALDCRSGRGLKELVPAVREVLADLLAKRKAKGMQSRPIRMMIVGVPNVGKSSLINKKLQLIQKLEPPCSGEKDLFDAAIRANPDKIIVKRPLKSECLAGREPSYTLKGKAIRYDCYVL